MPSWETFRAFLRLFGLGFSGSFIIAVVLVKFFSMVLPDWTILPLAVVLSPPLWSGLAMLILLRKYEQAVTNLASADFVDRAQAQHALRALERAYRRRERLARSRLKRGVAIGYLVQRSLLQSAASQHSLNAYWEKSEEVRQLRRRRSIATMLPVCDFVVRNSMGQPVAANAALRDVIHVVSPQLAGLPARIVYAAYNDGPGYLSTLTALTYLHYLSCLPEQLQESVLITADQAAFDVEEFGWVANRVLEAIIYLTVVSELSPEGIVARLTPLINRGHAALAAAITNDDKFSAKWQLRSELRNVSGLRDVGIR